MILGAGSLVPPGKVLESGFLYVGSPAKKARPLSDKERGFFTYTAGNYVKLRTCTSPRTTMRDAALRYPNILFDLDGTLTDPREGITRSVQFALARLGIDEPDLARLEHFIGPRCCSASCRPTASTKRAPGRR